jgi:hypothetical protein
MRKATDVLSGTKCLVSLELGIFKAGVDAENDILDLTFIGTKTAAASATAFEFGAIRVNMRGADLTELWKSTTSLYVMFLMMLSRSSSRVE